MIFPTLKIKCCYIEIISKKWWRKQKTFKILEMSRRKKNAIQQWVFKMFDKFDNKTFLHSFEGIL